MSKLVRNFIHDKCKLTQFDDDIVDFILGTIDVNAFKNITNPMLVNGKTMLPPYQKLVPAFTHTISNQTQTKIFISVFVVREKNMHIPFTDI